MQETTIYEVPGGKFNVALAEKLKSGGQFPMPEWAKYVKTSPANERPPQEKNWWWKRAASILRQLQIKGVAGVGKLRRKYSRKKDRGHKPDEVRKGSGKIIRTILQQGEKEGLIKKAEGKKPGRELTKQGLNILNQTAEEIKKEMEAN